MEISSNHKAGFINIIGAPNAGKSTLTNQLMGEKLSIITEKAQTTRHRILGLINHDDYQIVVSDTPGIVDPAYKLHEGMMQFVYSALQDADLILLLVDVGEKQFKNPEILEKVKQMGVPIFLLINKIDVSNQEALNERVSYWQEQVPMAKIFPISALTGFNVDTVFQEIIKALPFSPPYFDKEDLSDKPMRFFMSEIIREKIFLNYKKEIPYSCEVIVDEFKELPNIINILATIFVERDSQKGILIGHRGSMLKKVGTEARVEMETFLGKKVFLDLHVKVAKDWRKNDDLLKRFGYLNQ